MSSYAPPPAPVRPLRTVVLNRSGAACQFETSAIYRATSPHRVQTMHVAVVARTSNGKIMVKAADGATFDAPTLAAALEQVAPTRVSVFVDNDRVEYAYVLCHKVRACGRCHVV